MEEEALFWRARASALRHLVQPLKGNEIIQRIDAAIFQTTTTKMTNGEEANVLGFVMTDDREEEMEEEERRMRERRMKENARVRENEVDLLIRRVIKADVLARSDTQNTNLLKQIIFNVDDKSNSLLIEEIIEKRGKNNAPSSPDMLLSPDDEVDVRKSGKRRRQALSPLQIQCRKPPLRGKRKNIHVPDDAKENSYVCPFLNQ